jgi:hypothetical protein
VRTVLITWSSISCPRTRKELPRSRRAGYPSLVLSVWEGASDVAYRIHWQPGLRPRAAVHGGGQGPGQRSSTVNARRRGQDAENVERTDWFRARVMGAKTDYVLRFRERQRLFVIGRLEIGDYTRGRRGPEWRGRCGHGSQPWTAMSGTAGQQPPRSSRWASWRRLPTLTSSRGPGRPRRGQRRATQCSRLPKRPRAIDRAS